MPRNQPTKKPGSYDDVTSTPPETSARNPWRTAARVGLLVVAVLLTARIIWGYTAAKDVDEAAQAVLARGEPLTMETLPQPAADASDGWPVYKALLDSAAADGIGAVWAYDRKSKNGLATPAEMALLEKDKGDQDLMARLWQDLDLRKDPAVAEPLSQRLAHHAERLAQLRRASERAHVAWPTSQDPFKLNDTLLVPLPRLHQFLLAGALVKFDEGRQDEALADVAVAVRVANQFASIPTLQGYVGEASLLQNAGLVLQQMIGRIDASVPATRLAELRAELLKGPGPAELNRALLCSRATVYSMYARLVNNLPMYDALAGVERSATWATRLQTWLLRPYWDANEANTLRLYEQLVPLAQKPYYELADTLAQLRSEAGGAGPTKQWASQNFLLFHNLVLISTVDRANRELAATALAARQYQLEHGQLSDALQTLVPAYLPQAPVDPATGRLLGYRPDGEYPCVYSAGLDRADNAGQTDENDPGGQQGHDIVFYLSAPPPPAPTSQPASLPAK